MKKAKENPYFDRAFRKQDIPITAFSFLFSEMIQYMTAKSSEEKEIDLEEKLSSLGYPIGEKILEYCCARNKIQKRETRLNNMLLFIHNKVWEMLFGRQANGLQKSSEDEEEYRIVENEPITNKFISLQKSGSVNCAAFIGGIIEGILNSADFKCKVSPYFYEGGKTFYIIKFEKDVIARENQFNK